MYAGAPSEEEAPIGQARLRGDDQQGDRETLRPPAPGDRRDLQGRWPPHQGHREARSGGLARWRAPRRQLLGHSREPDLAKHRRARLAAACRQGEMYDIM